MKKDIINILKGVSYLGGIIFLIVMGVVLFKFFTSIVSDPLQFKVWLDGFGWLGKVILVLLMTLQVFAAFLPGEIIELGAGVAYGTIEGMVLCLIGAALGSYIILRLVKRFGVRIVEHFLSKDKLEQFSFLKNEQNLNVLVFIIFFLPGTPKDFLTYFAGLTSIKVWSFIGITTVARIPSVITSTIAGDYLMQNNMWMAGTIYAVTIFVSIGGLVLYKKIMKKKAKGIANENKCINTSV